MELKDFSVNISKTSVNGTLTTDMNNNVKSTFGFDEQFKVLIPVEELNTDVNIIVNINTRARSYPVFFAIAPSENLQNYALSFDSFEMSTNDVSLNEKTNTASIEIIKTDNETGETLQDVIFELRKDTGEIIGEYTTDIDGKIYIPDLYRGKYILKEISVNENYVLKDEEINISLLYNQHLTIDVTNEYKKGNLKISKVDRENNEIKLEGVKFDLLDSNRKIIGNYKTDYNGEIYIEKIKIGNYTIKEVDAKEGYIIDENEYEIEIVYNETREIMITNERIKELPKTGIDSRFLRRIKEILKKI